MTLWGRVIVVVISMPSIATRKYVFKFSEGMSPWYYMQSEFSSKFINHTKVCYPSLKYVKMETKKMIITQPWSCMNPLEAGDCHDNVHTRSIPSVTRKNNVVNFVVGIPVILSKKLHSINTSFIFMNLLHRLNTLFF